MFLSLTIICVVAGAILAGVNMYTTGPIAATKAAALEAAIKAVTPAFDNKPTEDAYMAVTADGDSLKIYPAMKDGKLVGAAVESNTQKGFSGEIKVIVGFDTEGKLLNYSVLQHSETPGLGAKMQEWFRADKNHQSVLGRKLADGELKVSKDGGDVDAITAATISSRAFLNAVNRAYSAFSGADGLTGATTSSDNTTKEGGNENEYSENIDERYHHREPYIRIAVRYVSDTGYDFFGTEWYEYGIGDHVRVDLFQHGYIRIEECNPRYGPYPRIHCRNRHIRNGCTDVHGSICPCLIRKFGIVHSVDRRKLYRFGTC